MLSLTRRSDYALIALSHLARDRERLCSAREIADIYRVPLPILMNVLKALAKHELVSSVRGAHGGYRLSMEPSEISLLLIVDVLEGPVSLFRCAQPEDHEARVRCGREDICPITATALGVSDKLQEFLRSVTLEDLTQRQPSADSLAANP